MRKSIFFLLPILICMMCTAFLLTPYLGETAKAEGDEDFEEVEVVSIAPPYYNELSQSVTFNVYFSAPITCENYKHVAAGISWLKENLERTPNFNPHLTAEKVDFLYNSGIWSSIRNCIRLKINDDEKKDKSVADYQLKGDCSCMIHMGELDVNICMQMEFDSSTGLSSDLSDEYEFTFKEGLKFPSGVILKEDSSWKFIKSDGLFEKIDESVDADNTDFIVNYNGKNITAEDNVITVSSPEEFSVDKIYVKTANPNATYKIEKKFEELQKGTNYVVITCTSESKIKKKMQQIVVKYEGSGCSSGIATGTLLPFALLPVLFIRRKRK